MALIIQKFGGTSAATVEKIEKIAQKVKSFYKNNNDLVVIVSAMNGETNRLLSLSRSITSAPSPRELDVILSTGEQVTIGLLAISLIKIGIPAISYTGGQAGFLTDSSYTKARILQIDVSKIRKDLKDRRVVVIAGFQGVDSQGNITTLGRGGSDTTSVALAAALEADECQIYTDVDGVYTTDPRVAPKARRLDRISFPDMLEMASMGSKVLQIRAVQLSKKYCVPLRVLHSFRQGSGTLVVPSKVKNSMEEASVSGIAFNRDEAKLTVYGIYDIPGITFKVLSAISAANIETDIILQNVVSNNTSELTFTMHRNDYNMARKILEGILCPILSVCNIIGNTTIAKVSLVGEGMRSNASIASKIFEVLAKYDINILMISSSETKVSVIIEEHLLELSVRVLHTRFNLDSLGD